MADDPQRFVVALSTAGSDEQAEQLARALVERRLAACVNIVGGVCSVYRWKGKIERDGEKLLVIKTSRDKWPELQRVLRELHSYEVPELLLLQVLEGEPEYLKWLAGELPD